MKILYPDYSRSIVNIAATLLRYYSLEPRSAEALPSLPELEKALENHPKNVVLMLFDGMGSSLLENHLPENSFLRKHKAADLTSVFPSSTVPATASIQSGLTPAETGRLGWNLYYPEAGDSIGSFMNDRRTSGKFAGFLHYAERHLPYESLWKQIRKQCPEVRTSLVSFYSLSHFTPTLSSLFDRVKSLSHREGPQFIYTYYKDPDHLEHRFGVRHEKVGSMIRRIDRGLESMASSLKDTLIIVTADHGQLDSRWIFLEDHPRLMEMIERPVSVETRACAIHVKPEYLSVFPEVFRREIPDGFLLMSREELLESPLLGPGVRHPRLKDFTGDFMAISTDVRNLGWTRKIDEFVIGNHGGLLPEEMTVPLILCRV